MQKLPFFPTLGTTLKKSFVELYNSMGFSFLISATWFTGFIPILLILYGILGSLVKTSNTAALGDRLSFGAVYLLVVAFWNGLVTGPLTTIFYSLFQVRKTDYLSLKMFWQIVKKVYRRSAAIHCVYSLIVAVLIINVIIALRSSNFLLVISVIISAYIVFLAVLASFYFNPLIHLDNSFKKVIKKSFLLVLDNIGLSISFSIFLGVMFLISIGLIFPLLLFYQGLALYTTDKGFELIYQKYDD